MRNKWFGHEMNARHVESIRVVAKRCKLPVCPFLSLQRVERAIQGKEAHAPPPSRGLTPN